MKKEIVFFLAFVFVLFIFSGIVSAEPPSNQLTRKKMIWDLPELDRFIFGGGVEQLDTYTHIDIRYISPKDNDQHSEFALDILNSPEEANVHFNDFKYD